MARPPNYVLAAVAAAVLSAGAVLLYFRGASAPEEPTVVITGGAPANPAPNAPPMLRLRPGMALHHVVPRVVPDGGEGAAPAP